MKTSNLIRISAVSIIMMATVFSCRNESQQRATEEEMQRDVAEEIAEDMEASLPALPYIAVFDEASEQLEAQKNPDFDRSLLSVDRLTQALITNYPEIDLQVNKVSNDTLYLRIIDAQYLTQQMGSSGAQMYLLEATYAYTELPDINSVNFGFEEGDHAIPGTYTRESFKQSSTIR